MLTAKEKRFYRPELDAVRFLAFFAVFCHHLLPKITPAHPHLVRACGFGLPLFFVLSAFLIGQLLLREKERYQTIDLRAFYIRRILRIWPLYFFALLVGCVYALLIDHKPHEVMAFGAFAAMLGNFAMIRWGMDGPMGPLWSISVEEQFYIFCPLAIRTLSRRGLLILSLSLITLSDVILFFGRSPSWVHDAWYSSLVQFQMFGAGLLLCLCRKPGIARPVFLLAAPCLWAIASFAMPHLGIGLVFAYSSIAAGCASLLYGMVGLDQKWLPRWVVWLGHISYGLYVFHVLVARRLEWHLRNHPLLWFVSSLSLTIALAAASYRWLESPFLRMKRRFELIKTRARSFNDRPGGVDGRAVR